MSTTYSFERLFRSPFSAPNGIALTAEGLWVADQATDRLALVSMHSCNKYGLTQYLRECSSESSNTSGMSYDSGSLWLAANGAAKSWRPARSTDASIGIGEVLQVDPNTGATLNRNYIPGGGGTHGIEVDLFDAGFIWLSTLKQKTLSKVRIADWSVVHTIPLLSNRSHGIVRSASAIWIVFTTERQIVEMDPKTGQVDRIVQIPADMPEPHGLTRDGPHLLYCDATTGWITRVHDVLDD